MERLFKLKERKTDVKTELIAGITTFVTMAYVLAVQPSAIVGFGSEPFLTDINGVVISKSAILVMCALISGLVTILMGLYANFPFALSAGMGTNFLLGALLQEGTMSFGTMMAITLISGLVFVALTLFGIRDLVVRMIPQNIKISISAAIGFFIAYLGFSNTGIGTYTNGIAMGDFSQPSVWLAVLGLIIIAVLTAFKVKGAILIGIMAITVLGIPFGITKVPETFFMVPDFNDIGNVCMEFDLKGVFTSSGFIWMFVAFFGDFFSTLGTVLGVAGKANMLDQDGNLPDIQKPFLVDAVGTCVGALTGNTTITTFVESTAGVESGGRTGLTAVCTGVLFLVSIFLSPLFLMIPNAATGPALIFVGFLMIGGIAEIDFSNFEEAFGPFIMVMFSAFTASFPAGMAAGILAHVALKLFTGKHRDLHPGMYVLCIPLIMYFIFG